MVAQVASWVGLPVLGQVVAVGGGEPTFLRVWPEPPKSGDSVVCRDMDGRLLVIEWSPDIDAALILGVVRGRITEG